MAGSSPVFATLRLSSALTNVDLPTLGTPMTIMRSDLTPPSRCGARVAASAGMRATSGAFLHDRATAFTVLSSAKWRTHAAVAAGSARSDLFSTFRHGRWRCNRKRSISGLLLAPGRRASRISITTSTFAMVFAASLRAASMWPGNQLTLMGVRIARSCRHHEPFHLAGQSFAADRHVEMAVADRHIELVAPLEARYEAGDEIAPERIQLERLGAVNALAIERAQQLSRVLVRVDGDAGCRLARLVQSRRAGRADLDPGFQHAGQVLHRDRRFIGRREPARKSDAFRVFQAIRQHTRDQVFITFRRMLGRLELERLVDAAIDVAEANGEVVDRRA